MGLVFPCYFFVDVWAPFRRARHISVEHFACSLLYYELAWRISGWIAFVEGKGVLGLAKYFFASHLRRFCFVVLVGWLTLVQIGPYFLGDGFLPRVAALVCYLIEVVFGLVFAFVCSLPQFASYCSSHIVIDSRICLDFNSFLLTSFPQSLCTVSWTFLLVLFSISSFMVASHFSNFVLYFGSLRPRRVISDSKLCSAKFILISVFTLIHHTLKFRGKMISCWLLQFSYASVRFSLLIAFKMLISVHFEVYSQSFYLVPLFVCLPLKMYHAPFL